MTFGQKKRKRHAEKPSARAERGESMGTIQSSIQITDSMTGPLRNMSAALNTVIGSLENMQGKLAKNVNVEALEKARNSITAAEKGFKKAGAQIDDTTARLMNIRSAESGFSRLNNKINGTSNSLEKAKTSAGALFKSLMGFSVVQKVINLVTNEIGGAIERMDTMTNFQRKMTVMTGSSDIAKAALNQLKDTTKGTAYGLDTAAAATQNFVTRGMRIGAATSQVAKWGDAVAFYGNGTNEQLSNVTDALGKMLSKGTVEMDQLNRLTDAGINAAGIYAQATGKSQAEVQKSLSKGEISAQNFISTVSTAFSEGTNGVLNVTGAAKEAGGTWATSIENMRAAVKRGIISVIDSINSALSKAGLGTILSGIQSFGTVMENVLTGAGQRIGNVITLLSPLFKLIQNIGNFMINNWSAIEPLLWGIIAAWVVLNATGEKGWLITMKNAAAKVWHAVCSAAETAAIIAMIAAQDGLNAAMAACPITWIIAAVIILIAVIITVIKMVKKAQGETISALGAILGAVFALGAAIINIIIGVINGIIQFVWTWFVYPIIGIVEWILNVCNGGFNSFGDAVKNLIGNIIGWFLSLGQVITKIIDAIFGTSWTSGLEGLKENVLSWGKNENAITLSREAPQIQQRIQYGAAFDKGASIGNGLSEKLGGIFGGDNALNETYGAELKDDVGETAENTAKLKDQVSSIGADLSVLRSLAEREAINQFTTATVKVDMNNVNHISSEMDLDGMVNKLSKLTNEALMIVAEGVHA